MIRHGLDDGHVVVQFSGPFSDQRGKTLQSQEQEVKTDTLRDLMPILPMILGCFRSAFLSVNEVLRPELQSTQGMSEG